MNQLFLAIVAVGSGWVEPGDADSVSEEQQRIEQQEFAKWAADAAASYDIRGIDAPETKLTLRPEPILKWSNPERGRIYGHVFIWTVEGRPEAIASLYKWYHPFTHSSHEFQSLALTAMGSTRDGTPAWSPARAGVKLDPLPDAPTPAKTAAERLRQMRSLVRQFRADETTREGETSSLRLLTQPIYRYEAAQEPVLDGALFAFVQATDPEIVLLLEARIDDQGNSAWHYGLARLNSITLRAYYNDQQVWTAPELPWNVVHDRTEPYFTVQFR